MKRNLFQRIFNLEEYVEPEQRTVYLDALGSTGTEIYGGHLQEEYFHKLQGTRRADEFDKIARSEPTIEMALGAIMNIIIGATWTIEGCEEIESETEREKQRALVEHILFEDMDSPWADKLYEILGFIKFGYSLFERTHKNVLNHPKFGSYTGIKCLGWRSQRTIHTWKVDKDGKLLSVEQISNGDLGRTVNIDAANLLLFNIKQEGSNYEGVSMLRPCYGAWKRKDILNRVNAVGTEKYAVPTPLVTSPDGATPEQEAKMKQVLTQYTSHKSAYIIKPQGWEVDLKSNPYDPEKTLASIRHENLEMTNAFLMSFLLLGQGTSGSYALANDLSDFFLSGLDYLAERVKGPINNKLIPEIVKLNFGDQPGYPKLKHADVSDKAGKELAEILKILIDGRVIKPDDQLEETMRKRYRFPPVDETSVREAPVAQPFGSPNAPNAQVPPIVPPKEKDLAEKTKALLERYKWI